MPNTGKSITITNVPFSPKRIDGYAYWNPAPAPNSSYATALCINLYGFNQMVYFMDDGYVYNMGTTDTPDKYVGASIKKNSSNKYDITLTLSDRVSSKYIFYVNTGWRFWFSNSMDWTQGN